MRETARGLSPQSKTNEENGKKVLNLFLGIEYRGNKTEAAIRCNNVLVKMMIDRVSSSPGLWRPDLTGFQNLPGLRKHVYHPID